MIYYIFELIPVFLNPTQLIAKLPTHRVTMRKQLAAPSQRLRNRNFHDVHQDSRHQFDQVPARVHAFGRSVFLTRLALLGVLLVKDKVLHRGCGKEVWWWSHL